MWINDAEVSGLGQQLLAQVLSKAGIRLQRHFEGNWKRCLAGLKAGSIDFVASAYITDQRKLFMQYTEEPLSNDPVHLFMWHSRQLKITDWQDLIGKRMVALHGDSHGQRFDQFASKKLDVTEVNSVAQALKMLATGRADFMAGGLHPWTLRVQAHGYKGRILSSRKIIENQPLHIGVAKNSRCRGQLSGVDQYLREIKRSEGYQQALQGSFDSYLLQQAVKK